MTDALICPHGGTLVNRMADPASQPARAAAVKGSQAIRLTPVQHSDLFCIATGVFSPLTGFVGRADYESIVDRMRLADGTVWSIPVTLAVAPDVARAIGRRATLGLEEPQSRLAAA